MTSRFSQTPRLVYFIRPVGMAGPVKIGSSVMPEKRLRELGAFCPFELELVAILPGTRELEARFHALFAADHQRGEWFAASTRLDAVIAQVAARTFDVSTLPEPLNINTVRPRPVRPFDREIRRFAILLSRLLWAERIHTPDAIQDEYEALRGGRHADPQGAIARIEGWIASVRLKAAA